MSAIYWTSTLLVSAMTLWSAYGYLFDSSMIEGVKELGFPGFFIIQLAVLKILGVIALVAPGLPVFVKEWAYAGIGLFFITGLVAHIAHRDSLTISLLLLVFLALLVVSNVSMHRLEAV